MQRRRWISLGVAAVVLFAVLLKLRSAIGLEFNPDSLRTAVEGLGVWAPLAFVGIVTFRVPLGVPSQLLLIGGGLLFGAIEGTLYGAAGLVCSALGMFAASRWAGGVAVVPGRFHYLLDVAGSRVGAVFIAVGTGYPVGPITWYHLMAGVTRMAMPVFAVAVAIGSVVRAAIYTYFGSSLADGDQSRLLAAGALLLLALLVPLAFPTPRAWLLQAFARRDPS